MSFRSFCYTCARLVIILLVLTTYSCNKEFEPDPPIVDPVYEEQSDAQSTDNTTQFSSVDDTTPLEVINQNTENKLLIFAIDESMSVPMSTNCDLSDARYQIPNLILPILGQYYYSTPIGVTSLDKLAPWVEVVRWPRQEVALGPISSSSLTSKDWNITKKDPSNGVFYDKVFSSSNILATEFPDKQFHVNLILFTDGSFQGNSDNGGSSPSKLRNGALNALKSLSEKIEKKEIDIEIHTVLLCENMNDDDRSWWGARDKDYDWFHLYQEKDLPSLIQALWINTIATAFPYPWNSDWQRAFLLGEQGYFELGSLAGGENSFADCSYAKQTLRCIEFEFPPRATGLLGGISPVSTQNSEQRIPFIWQDDKISIFPSIMTTSGNVLWDGKVIPTETCSPHTWTFNPYSSLDKPVIFWWRTAIDTIPKLNVNTRDIKVYYGDGIDKVSDDVFGNLETVSSMLSLKYISQCYYVTLNYIEEKQQKIQIDKWLESEGEFRWNATKALELYKKDYQDNPSTLTPNLAVELKYINNPQLHLSETINIDVQVIYIPTFVEGGFIPCKLDQQQNGQNSYICTIEFRYIGDKYVSKDKKETYQPHLYFVNDKEKPCGDFSIPYNEGDKIKIKNIKGDTPGNQKYQIFISETFFSTVAEACSDVETVKLQIKWDNWDLEEDESPRAWECSLTKSSCEIIGGE